jgi:hypothetical protein
MLITESSWVPPLGYQSEGPFLVSAYSSLNGVDVFYWFATGVEEWWQPQSANSFVEAIGKWVCATPELMGNFPAAALMFRKNYIKRGEPVVVECRPLKAMWHGIPPVIAEDPGYDPNRDLGDAAKLSNLKGGVHPFAFLIGPVIVKYEGHPTNTFALNLRPYIDAKRKLIKSDTGQIVMDCDHGVCILNAPKAQGISGFVGQIGACKLDDVVIDCTNAYATITAVAMDDQPLSASQKVLVQIGTQSRPSGWRVYESTFKSENGEQEYKGYEIMDTGRQPWRVTKAYGTLSIANPALTNAIVLDMNGMPEKALPTIATNGTVRVQLPEDAIYVVLQPTHPTSLDAVASP